MTPEEQLRRLTALIRIRDELNAQLKCNNANLRDMLNSPEIVAMAPHKTGEKAGQGHKIYEISRVKPVLGYQDKLTFRYFGRLILKDGVTLHKREDQLWFL